MDRITKSLFEDYTKRNSLEGVPEDEAFERFVSFCVLTPELAETFDTDDVITGGGNDLGIDAIATIVNGRLVLSPDEVGELVERNRFLEAEFVFIQAKRSANFNTAEIGNFLFGVKDFFADEPKLPQNDAIKDLVALQRHIYNNSAEMSRGKPTVRLFYATTGRWTGEAPTSGRVTADVDDLKATNLFSNVQFNPVDADLLQKLYQRTRNKTSAEFIFTSRVVIPDVRNVEQAYIGIVPGTELLKLVMNDSGEVRKSAFYDNVRDFLDYNEVNNEIAATLKSAERDRFALLNNGVTVIAKTANAVANKFHIEDYQIVNGCQTSHVLADCKDVQLTERCANKIK
jgi:hypothetical protein